MRERSSASSTPTIVKEVCTGEKEVTVIGSVSCWIPMASRKPWVTTMLGERSSSSCAVNQRPWEMVLWCRSP